MSEASYLTELREAAPPAPERLRELVMTLPAPKPRVSLRARPALSAALGVLLAVGVAAAIVGGISSSPPAGETDAASSGDHAARALSIPAQRASSPGGSTQRSEGARTDAHREVAPAAPGCLDEPPRQRPLRRNPERGAHDAAARRVRRRRRLHDRLAKKATHGWRCACPSRTSRRRSPASRSSERLSASTSRLPTSRVDSTASTRASQQHDEPATPEP